MKPVSFSIDNNILYTQGLYIMATITVWLLLTVLHESYWQCCPLPLLALSQCRQLEKKAGEIGGKMERKNGESVSPLQYTLFPSHLAPPPPLQCVLPWPFLFSLANLLIISSDWGVGSCCRVLLPGHIERLSQWWSIS